MSGIPLAPLLLLAQARIEAMPPVVQTVDVTEAVNNSPTFGLAALALIAVVVLLVAIFVVRFALRRSNANWQMFKEMCQAHELSRGQCRSLQRLSRQLRIANPNRLFLEAELWSPTLADSAPARANQPAAASRPQEELHRLREKLFTPA